MCLEMFSEEPLSREHWDTGALPCPVESALSVNGLRSPYHLWPVIYHNSLQQTSMPCKSLPILPSKLSQVPLNPNAHTPLPCLIFFLATVTI